MNDEEILAIAEKYGTSQTRHRPTYHLHNGEPTGETYPQTDWDFGQEDLLAFAQEVRAYESEDDPWPMCYWDGDDKPGSIRFDKRTERHRHPLYRHFQRPTGLDQLLERIRFLEQQIAERNK